MYRILLFSFVFLSLDQVSKWLVVFYFELEQKLYLNLNNQFMNFYMAWNKGINFGLFEGDSTVQAYILTAISIIISIVFFVWLRNSTRFLIQILASLVIGGAVACAGIGASTPYMFKTDAIKIQEQQLLKIEKIENDLKGCIQQK